MTDSFWFSVKMRFVVIGESRGFLRYMDSVRLFRSADFDHAFSRALEIGLADQKEYLNADNERIAWKLVSIISLDRLPRELADGQEIYSEPVEHPGEHFDFSKVFDPASSHPTQTL